MRALLFKPDHTVAEIDIENNLKALQRAVGGYIETVTIAEDACLICNEEGLLLGLEQHNVFGMIFAGNVLMVGTKGEEFTDLSEGICKRLDRRYRGK